MHKLIKRNNHNNKDRIAFFLFIVSLLLSHLQYGQEKEKLT